jgi:hypothetical protein
MATYSLSPLFNGWQGFNAAGQPLNLGTITVYLAGTNTPTTTWTSSTGAIANSNPITLTNGFPPDQIWLQDSVPVKFVVKDAAGSTLSTDDNVSSLGSVADALRTDLADTASAAKGAALVGFKRSVAYPANTLGRQALAFKSILADGTVKGDGTTPDSAAIASLIGSGGQWTFPAATYLWDAAVPVPDSTTLEFQQGAIIKPSANNLTLFTSKNYGGTYHSYFSQFIDPYFDSNGKTGVVCFDMTGFRHAAAIVRPKFVGAFDHCIKLTELCWDAVIDEPFAQGCINGILIGHGSNAVQVRKPGIDGLGSTGYGIKIIGGATYPTTSTMVIGGYIQGFSGAGGVGAWDNGAGTAVGVYGTKFDTVYFENNAFADVYFETSRYGQAVGCQHYANVGTNGYYGRNNDGVKVFSPLMTNGSRTYLYNFDTSNTNCFGDQTYTSGGINLPLGTVSGIGYLPTEVNGTWTPVVAGSTGAGTCVYVSQTGTWRRIGRQVNVKCYVKWNTHTGTGAVTITGVPAALTPSSYTPSGLGKVICLTAWAGAELISYLNGTGTVIQITQLSTAGASTVLPIPALGELTIDLTYDL